MITWENKFYIKETEKWRYSIYELETWKNIIKNLELSYFYWNSIKAEEFFNNFLKKYRHDILKNRIVQLFLKEYYDNFEYENEFNDWIEIQNDRDIKIKNILLNAIENFDDENIQKIKEISHCFLWYYSKNQFDQKRTEKEIENNSFVFELKKWNFVADKLEEIIKDIKRKIDIDEIDFITYTPDSWNFWVKHSEILPKWFSTIVLYLAKRLWKPTIIPEITRNMWKQKDQKTMKDRLKNRLWAYSFNKNNVEWKRILFIDDVLTTWATMLWIAQDIYNKWWNLELYFIADAEKDEDFKN